MKRQDDMAITTKAIHAKGLDAKRLEEIRNLPNEEGCIQMYQYLWEVLGRKKVTKDVVFEYGFWNNIGEDSFPPRIPSMPTATMLRAVGLRVEEDELMSPDMRETYQRTKKSRGNMIPGEYPLTVTGTDKETGKPVSVKVTYNQGVPGKHRFDPASGRNVQDIETRSFNVPYGRLEVNPLRDEFLFAWLCLHPSTYGSPARFESEAECQARGVNVTTTRDFTMKGDALREANLKMNAQMVAEDSALLDQVRDAGMKSVIVNAPDASLREWFRNDAFEGLLRIRSSGEVSLRDQYIAGLCGILSLTGHRGYAAKDALLKLIEGGNEGTAEIVRQAFELGVLDVVDGDYYFISGGKKQLWEDVIIRASRKGEEQDVLVEHFAATGEKKRITDIETAIDIVMSDEVRAKQTYAEHDSFINAAIADGTVFMSPNAEKRWYVKSGDGQEFLLARNPNMSKENQTEALRKWARGMHIEALKQKLTALAAD